MTKKKEEDKIVVNITAVKDEGVFGEGRIHYVFPATPKDAARALRPNITGGIWIKKGAVIPDQLVIEIPKPKDEITPKTRKKKEEA